MKKRLLKILPIILVAICSVFILTACVDADVEVQKAKLESKGYFAHDLLTGGYNTMGAEAAYMFVLNSTDDVEMDRVYVLYFSSDSDAKAYERNFLDYALPTLQKYNPDVADEYYYIRIGKIYIHGTERGFEDALD